MSHDPEGEQCVVVEFRRQLKMCDVEVPKGEIDGTKPNGARVEALEALIC